MMSDITMCVSRDCPSRHKCLRKMAVVNPVRQVYASYYQPGVKKCLDFMAIHKSDKVVRKEDRP